MKGIFYLRDRNATGVRRLTHVEKQSRVDNNPVVQNILNSTIGSSGPTLRKATHTFMLVPEKEYLFMYEDHMITRYMQNHRLVLPSGRALSERGPEIFDFSGEDGQEKRAMLLEDLRSDVLEVVSTPILFSEGALNTHRGWFHIHDPRGWADESGAHHFFNQGWLNLFFGRLPDMITHLHNVSLVSEQTPEAKIIIKGYDSVSGVLDAAIALLQPDGSYVLSTKKQTLFPPFWSFYHIDRAGELAYLESYDHPFFVEDYSVVHPVNGEPIPHRKFSVDLEHPDLPESIRVFGVMRRNNPAQPHKYVTFFPLIDARNYVQLLSDADVVANLQRPGLVIFPEEYPFAFEPYVMDELIRFIGSR